MELFAGLMFDYGYEPVLDLRPERAYSYADLLHLRHTTSQARHALHACSANIELLSSVNWPFYDFLIFILPNFHMW